MGGATAVRRNIRGLGTLVAISALFSSPENASATIIVLVRGQADVSIAADSKALSGK